MAAAAGIYAIHILSIVIIIMTYTYLIVCMGPAKFNVCAL